MKGVGKIVAWLCIFSTLFTGCYSSAMIDPTGEEKEKMYSGEIQVVITKQGTKYWFEKPPTIVNDAIVGEAKIYRSSGPVTEKVSIALSDVEQVKVEEFNAGQTYLLLGVVGLTLLGIYFKVDLAPL